MTAAPAACGEIQFQIAVTGSCPQHGLSGFFGKYGAPHVGMYHNARGVERRPETRAQTALHKGQQAWQLAFKVQVFGGGAAPGADVLPPNVPISGHKIA